MSGPAGHRKYPCNNLPLFPYPAGDSEGLGLGPPHQLLLLPYQTGLTDSTGSSLGFVLSMERGVTLSCVEAFQRGSKEQPRECPAQGQCQHEWTVGSGRGPRMPKKGHRQKSRASMAAPQNALDMYGDWGWAQVDLCVLQKGDCEMCSSPSHTHERKMCFLKGMPQGLQVLITDSPGQPGDAGQARRNRANARVRETFTTTRNRADARVRETFTIVCGNEDQGFAVTSSLEALQVICEAKVSGLASALILHRAVLPDCHLQKRLRDCSRASRAPQDAGGQGCVSMRATAQLSLGYLQPDCALCKVSSRHRSPRGTANWQHATL
ncbi:hypothetical protein TREES_T100014224 [Tupaia chinensis]|uniref:Uncharacterized protein n=1 Tax=Tupaia chinensis TaxID=246437 RepID=L9KGF0_TUPCH|nr:hypothetical protein TREES_T100014224 [Tupaia chinensis]